MSILQLFWLTMRFMLAAVPADDPISRHGRLATANVSVMWEEGPLYAGEDAWERTVALLVSVEDRESSLRHDARGDCDERDTHGRCISPPRSFCATQIHVSSGGSEALIDDTERCVRIGYQMLKRSIRVDRKHPIAWYARGPRFESKDAQDISDDRMRHAAALRAKVGASWGP